MALTYPVLFLTTKTISSASNLREGGFILNHSLKGYRLSWQGGLLEFMAVGVYGSDSYILEEATESLYQNCLAITLKTQLSTSSSKVPSSRNSPEWHC